MNGKTTIKTYGNTTSHTLDELVDVCVPDETGWKSPRDGLFFYKGAHRALQHLQAALGPDQLTQPAWYVVTCALQKATLLHDKFVESNREGD